MQLKQSGIVYAGLVHNVKRASLYLALLAENIEYLDIVHLAVANVGKTGNGSFKYIKVLSLMAALAVRNGAQLNRLKHRSMVDESSA